MKSNLRFIFAWIVSLLILASCSSEEIATGLEPVVKESGLKYMEFTASAGADTRTQLTSDNKVEWVAGDEISIFEGTAKPMKLQPTMPFILIRKVPPLRTM